MVCERHFIEFSIKIDYIMNSNSIALENRKPKSKCLSLFTLKCKNFQEIFEFYTRISLFKSIRIENYDTL